jgi:Putative transmembrane protein (PGPGW)
VKWLQKLADRVGLDRLIRILRRIVVAVIGGTILLIGIALIVLPGPAFVVIPLGLVILASEFAWARSLLRRGRELIGKIRGRRTENAVIEEKQ